MNEITEELMNNGVTIQDLTSADLHMLADSLGVLDVANIRIDRRLAENYWSRYAARSASRRLEREDEQ